jgi:hypothetical protein
MPKQIYSWGKVKPGDIISFRYQSKDGNKLSTILVLNPRVQLYRETGNNDLYLVGLKLESQGNVPHIRNKNEMVELLNRIGTLQVVDVKNEIFRLEIKGVGTRGFKQSEYNKLKKFIEQNKAYRTYKYEKVTNSQVFLEPIVLPKQIKEAIIGT